MFEKRLIYFSFDCIINLNREILKYIGKMKGDEQVV